MCCLAVVFLNTITRTHTNTQHQIGDTPCPFDPMHHMVDQGTIKGGLVVFFLTI